MLKHLKFLFPGLAEQDSTRQNLTWIKCTIKSGQLFMIAANGFIIKTVDVKTDQADCEFYIDFKAVKKAISIAKKADFVTILKDRINIENVSVNYVVYDHGYPDLSAFFTGKENQKKNDLSLNMKYLQLALKDGISGGEHEKIKIKHMSGQMPFYKIDFLNEYNYFSYVMPILDDTP